MSSTVTKIIDKVCVVSIEANTPTQDRYQWYIVDEEEGTRRNTRNSFFSIYDGHGGDECSQFLAEHLNEKIEDNFDRTNTTQSRQEKLKSAIRKGFFAAEADFEKLVRKKPEIRSGSCAIVVFMEESPSGSVLTISNVGDSKAVLAREHIIAPQDNNNTGNTSNNNNNNRRRQLQQQQQQNTSAMQALRFGHSAAVQRQRRQLKPIPLNQEHNGNNEAERELVFKRSSDPNAVRLVEEGNQEEEDDDDEEEDDDDDDDDNDDNDEEEEGEGAVEDANTNEDEEEDEEEEEEEDDDDDDDLEDEDDDEEEEEEAAIMEKKPVWRVAGSLMVTRAFGDLFLKKKEFSYRPFIHHVPYITCEPEIREQVLTPNDKFMVISSDGLWENFSEQEVVNMIGEFKAEYDARFTSSSSAARNIFIRSLNDLHNQQQQSAEGEGANGSGGNSTAAPPLLDARSLMRYLSERAAVQQAQAQLKRQNQMSRSAKLELEQVMNEHLQRRLSEMITEQFMKRVAKRKGLDVEFLKSLPPEQRRYVYDDTTIIVVFFKDAPVWPTVS